MKLGLPRSEKSLPNRRQGGRQDHCRYSEDAAALPIALLSEGESLSFFSGEMSLAVYDRSEEK